MSAEVPTMSDCRPTVARDVDHALSASGNSMRPVNRTSELHAAIDVQQRQLAFFTTLADRYAAGCGPDELKAEVLAHAASVLDAGAVFVDRDGCCMRVEWSDSGTPSTECTAEVLRATLAERIEFVRTSGEACTATMRAETAGTYCDIPLLLAPLAEPDTETAVVVFLRGPDQKCFTQTDRAAVQSILTFAEHLLRGAAALRGLQQTGLQTVCTLVNAIDAKDNYTSDHSERVGFLARMTGEALGLRPDQVQTLEWAGLLHDVGKIGIPETILNKPGVLTPSEIAQMQTHPRIGCDMLRPVAQFQPFLDAVLYHHENHDGSGYPEGLRGDEIPLEARIIHVVDVFDALTTDRPYRRAFDFNEALDVVLEGAGRITDPEITRVFVDRLRRFMAEEPDNFRMRFEQRNRDSKKASHI